MARRLIDKDLIKKFADKDEIDVVSMAKSGDDEATLYLFRKYYPVIRSIASNYFFMGSDREDVFQEGMFGFYKAIRDFNQEKSISFSQFARLCVSRQIMATAKKASGPKHKPLNFYISLDKYVYDENDGNKTMFDVVSDNRVFEPDKEVIYYELSQDLKKVIREKLSSFERNVVALHLESESYEKIAQVLRCEVKSVDNALQRARKKIRNAALV
ncbi:MAG: sigma-70 family RNA polymerase sigma factor [Candidatus Eremiobacterota bacterium]